MAEKHTFPRTDFDAYSMPVKETLSHLLSDSNGLTSEEVTRRLEHYGPNALPEAPPKPAWLRFLQQFRNVLIYILLVSAVISFALQHYVDAGVIVGVVLVNAIVGFIQEGKAEAALRAIFTMTKAHCLVVRDGALVQIDSSDLVPGDVVSLQAGDRVPADIRLIYCKECHCDESALTGESLPVAKQTEGLALSTPLAERTSMAYLGTLVTAGSARGVVVRTGVTTEIGKISELVSQVKIRPTPLQNALAKFAVQLSIGTLLLAALAMMFGIFLRDYSAAEMFQAAIGIAVASIPEGLPAIVTITLAIGVQRMAARKALMRRLPSVEVLGAVDVICSDKTGTLTTNSMTVRNIVIRESEFTVSGDGYSPQGRICAVGEADPVALNSHDVINQLCLLGVLCNDAAVSEQHDDWVINGDPTEAALLVMASKHGYFPEGIRQQWMRVDELPFSSERRYMATLCHNGQGDRMVAIKGAPEKLIPHCRWQLTSSGQQTIDYDFWNDATQKLAETGNRVLAIATQTSSSSSAMLNSDTILQELTIIGLVGISDPPRTEVLRSIASCHNAGIRVKMITGDNPITALAIGEELGLSGGKVMTGQDLDALEPDGLKQVAQDCDVFARASPENKLKLVDALQSSGYTVAMTGDGVNDAPALKQADIGVAMGLKGTDAAKEAADIVLTDDNFTTIEQAIAAGRTVYDNIVKSILFVLPTNLAEALIIIVAILAGRMLPITPAQILWINMITAITLALSLAFESQEQGVMDRPPRSKDQNLITLALFGRMLLVGFSAAIIVFALFNYYRELDMSIEYARTVAVNALVVCEAFYLINCRYLNKTIFSRHFVQGAAPVTYAIILVMLVQFVFTYWSPMQQLFGSRSLSLQDWGIIALASLPILLIVEVEKFVLNKTRGENRETECSQRTG